MVSKKKSSKTVYVGLSGGVDSAVSAALLKKEGYEVTGVFIKVWQPDWIDCNWKEERREAMRVAAHLDIPFVTLDLEKEYKKGVIDYMIEEYKDGRTPNPDVMCNREVKFGAFWDWAEKRGADYIATGHYAKNVFKNGIWNLQKSSDKEKDQTYFLWTLNQRDLTHVLFPIGSLEKTEVRALAKKFRLPNALKKDSQGLCFIGKLDLKDFLSHYIKMKPGDVIDESGRIIGKHPGSELFTIGERHGFTIVSKKTKEKPYFVIAKDVGKNTITVSNYSNVSVTSSLDNVKIRNISWVGNIPTINKYYEGRSRYRQKLGKLKIISIDNVSATIRFDSIENVLTPGQSLVIYDGKDCLGGGVII